MRRRAGTDPAHPRHNGKEIIFTTGETFTFLEKTLTAGKTYWLHEVEPAPGYATGWTRPNTGP